MTLHKKYLLYLEIAKLVEAGFGMRETAATILETGVDEEQSAFLESVKDSLEQGRSIAEAFSESPMELTQMEASIIEAGERSARLGPAFHQLGEYFELLSTSRKEMLKSLIYPGLLLHAGVLLSVIPFNIGMEPPSGMSVLGKFLLGLILAYLVVFALFLMFRKFFREAPTNAGLDRALGKIPFLGKARKNLALARFTKVYHGSLVSGLSMHQTVTMACEASHSGVIHEASQALLKTVDAGQPVGPALQKQEVFPSAFSRSYLTAEKAGSLDKDLDRWGNVFAEDARSSAKRVAVVIPQIFYGIVALYIGWKIVSFYSGYYQQIEDALEY